MKIKFLMLLLFSGFSMLAQQQLPLDDLSNFKSQAGNWQIVGSVSMNRDVDVHKKEEPADTKKKKRKKKKKNAVEAPKAVLFTEGTGILLNNFQEGKKDNLLTSWEHGDLYLEMDVMLPKGSNSGIYLQGRYELQLNDSWGVQQPKFSDIGGIYRNWESTPGKIFRGIAPLSNAAKAPGLWQTLKIHFKAPRFDANGKKTENAKLVFVDLNGVRIHNNVEIPLPTGGPISNTEVAKGPIMIQGDHGAVAIRNIKYATFEDSKATISDVTYKTYKGHFRFLEDLDSAEVVKEGTSNNIDVTLTGEEDSYGIVYNGTLNIPQDGDYTLNVGYTGGASLTVDGKLLKKDNYSDAGGNVGTTLHLTKGAHSFSISNIKDAGWRAARLGFTLTTATTNPKEFHAYDSYPPRISSVSPIYVDAETAPRLLRGFVSFKGNEKRLSHTIGVGTPTGVNFVYDLKGGNIIGLWRGEFVDATPMWHQRGDGSFRPKGGVQWTFLNQPLAELSSANRPFPEEAEKDFISKGYSIDKATGMPIFKHTYKGTDISQKVNTNASNTFVTNEISFSNTGLTNWYYKLADGAVEKMADGSYAIGDHQYYIKVNSAQTPVERTVGGETELVIPVDGSTINYDIIW